jgi:hypothetical protein
MTPLEAFFFGAIGGIVVGYLWFMLITWLTYRKDR